MPKSLARIQDSFRPRIVLSCPTWLWSTTGCVGLPTAKFLTHCGFACIRGRRITSNGQRDLDQVAGRIAVAAA